MKKVEMMLSKGLTGSCERRPNDRFRGNVAVDSREIGDRTGPHQSARAAGDGSGGDRLNDVLNVLSNGQIFENYPDHRRGACCLLHGIDVKGRDIHVVCTTANPAMYHHHGILAVAAQVDFNNPAENPAMRCSIADCADDYEAKTVIHTVRSKGRVLVIDHVPAEVCALGGDVIFTPQTVRRIEAILANLPEPVQTIPLFEYA